MPLNLNPFNLIRILIGLFFIVSGGEKLIGPYQNFMYVVEQYEIFPGWSHEIIAHVMPWIEFLLGVFLVVGLWLRATLITLAGMLMCFIVILGQALIRKLPITECGCLGEMITLKPQQTIWVDVGLLCLTFLLIKKYKQTSKLGLDLHF